jgi:transposase, IS6 family
VKGQVNYLYRAVDSAGQTIDFLLTAKRDAAAAKRFFQKVWSCSANPIPRVINVDKNPAYPAAIHALQQEGALPRRVRLRQCKFLNNVIEQDHRVSKKRTWLAKGYNTFPSARRTLEGIETLHLIRKGRVRWVAKKDVVAEAKFVAKLFGLPA